MAGMFGVKVPKPLPVVNPSDTANRINSAMAAKLQAGGSNADMTSQNVMAPVGGGRQPTLTGLN